LLWTGGAYVDLGLLAGAVIVACAAGMRTQPRNRRQLGALILVVALVSFFGVSGFGLGSTLAVIGGALAIWSRGVPFVNRTGGSVLSNALGPPCPRCGKHIPTWTSKCPYCGYPE
ncbi:MAG: zinc ribbon domain-containing protein, partial [Thermoplasmata archaeon]|nr:zinc ribbon domain-containing protein [Thermoplasmata archaeon]